MSRHLQPLDFWGCSTGKVPNRQEQRVERSQVPHARFVSMGLGFSSLRNFLAHPCSGRSSDRCLASLRCRISSPFLNSQQFINLNQSPLTLHAFRPTAPRPIPRMLHQLPAARAASAFVAIPTASNFSSPSISWLLRARLSASAHDSACITPDTDTNPKTHARRVARTPSKS
jgi:hypothetical protein